MKYDHFFLDEAGKREHLWAYRPLPHKSENFPLIINGGGYARWRKEAMFSRTNSTEFFVEYVCTGNVTLIQDQQEYCIAPGEIYLLRKGSDHQYMAGPAGFVVKRFVQIDGASVDYHLRSLGLWSQVHIRPPQPQLFKNIFKQIIMLFAHAPDGADAETDVQLSCLAYQLLLELSRTNQPSIPPMIETALKFMHEHLHRPLSRQDICDHVGVSAPYFSRIFAEYLECSPITYFLEQKFNWTAQLLKTTSLSIKEISDRAGFESPLYFSAQFKKHFGFSPKQYREYENLHVARQRQHDYHPCT